MPTYGTTVKHALRKLLGTNPISDVDAGIGALADDIDALMAVAVQGSFASRPTSTSGTPGKSGRVYYATDTKQLFYDHGTGWIEVAQTVPLVGGWGARPTSSPSEGQQFVVETGTGTLWTFRYRATNVRWEFVGGPPALYYDATERTTSNTSRALLTGSPEYTPPFTGLYEISHGFTGSNSQNSIVYQVLANATDAITDFAAVHNAAGELVSVSHAQRVVLTGGTAYRLYNWVGAGTGSFRYRWLRVQPIYSSAA